MTFDYKPGDEVYVIPEKVIGSDIYGSLSGKIMRIKREFTQVAEGRTYVLEHICGTEFNYMVGEWRFRKATKLHKVLI